MSVTLVCASIDHNPNPESSRKVIVRTVAPFAVALRGARSVACETMREYYTDREDAAAHGWQRPGDKMQVGLLDHEDRLEKQP